MKSATRLDVQLGKELKRLRKLHGYCQKKLFENLQLNSQQQLSNLESGKKHFTDELILRICQLFLISVPQFLNEARKHASLSETTSTAEFKAIDEVTELEIRAGLYKKMAIESKLEAIDLKLKQLGNRFPVPNFKPSKHKVYVIV